MGSGAGNQDQTQSTPEHRVRIKSVVYIPSVYTPIEKKKWLFLSHPVGSNYK